MTQPLLLKHKLMRDVAFQVLDMYYKPRLGKVTIGVIWWNIGDCHEPYSMNVVDDISVPPEWLNDLEEYNYISTRNVL